jgi:hypothetical protein
MCSVNRERILLFSSHAARLRDYVDHAAVLARAADAL